MEADQQDERRSELWRRRCRDIRNASFARIAAELTAKRLAEWEADPKTIRDRVRFCEDPDRNSEPVFTTHKHANADRMRAALLALHALLGDEREGNFSAQQVADAMAAIGSRGKCDRKTACRALRDLEDACVIIETPGDRARWKGGDGPNRYRIVFATLRDLAATQGLQGLLFDDDEGPEHASAARRGRPDKRSGEHQSAEGRSPSASAGNRTTPAARSGQPNTRFGAPSEAEQRNQRPTGEGRTLTARIGQPDTRSGACDGLRGDSAIGPRDLGGGHRDPPPGHGDLPPQVTEAARIAPLKSSSSSEQKDFNSSSSCLSSSIGGGGRNRWSDQDERRLAERLRELRANDPTDFVRFPLIVLRYARDNGWRPEQVDELIAWFLARRIGDVLAHGLTELCSTLKSQPPGSRISFPPCYAYSKAERDKNRQTDLRRQAAARDLAASEKAAKAEAERELESAFGRQLDQLAIEDARELINRTFPGRFARDECLKSRTPSESGKPFGMYRILLLRALEAIEVGKTSNGGGRNEGNCITAVDGEGQL